MTDVGSRENTPDCSGPDWRRARSRILYLLACALCALIAASSTHASTPDPARAYSEVCPPDDQVESGRLGVESVGRFSSLIVSQPTGLSIGTAVVVPYRLCSAAADTLLNRVSFTDSDAYKRSQVVRLLGMVSGHDVQREEYILEALTVPYVHEYNDSDLIVVRKMRRGGLDPERLFGAEGRRRPLEDPNLFVSAIAAATTLPQDARGRIYDQIESDLHEILYRGVVTNVEALIPFLASLPDASEIALKMLGWAKTGPPLYKKAAVALVATIDRPSAQLKELVGQECDSDWDELDCLVISARWGDEDAFDVLANGLTVPRKDFLNGAYPWVRVEAILFFDLGAAGHEVLRRTIVHAPVEAVKRSAHWLCYLGNGAGEPVVDRLERLAQANPTDDALASILQRCRMPLPSEMGLVALSGQEGG